MSDSMRGASEGAVRVYVARQPIFDVELDVFGYELLFRDSPLNAFPRGADVDRAARQTMGDSFHAFGLDKLAAQSARLFFNCTREVLVDGTCTLLPPAIAVIEVLETTLVDASVVAALRDLRARGHLVALDDFLLEGPTRELVELADIVKVDFLSTTRQERAEIVKRFKAPGVRFLAERVETSAQLGEAADLGYELFQGYFFARPEVIEGRDVPATKLARLRLMAAILNELDLERLEEAIKSDVALSVKLLQYLNSAHFGWTTRIDSIKRAIFLLGQQAFRQWASLVTVSSLCVDRPSELLVMTIVRARFCEQLAIALGRAAQSFQLFLCGLLSTLDALLARPLESLLDAVAASVEVCGALEHGVGPLADLYEAVRTYERGEFTSAALVALGADDEVVARTYLEAVAWADALMTSS